MNRPKSTASLVLAVLAALGLAGPAAAGERVPFQGRLEGDVTRTPAPPLVLVDIEATGHGRGASICGIRLAWEEGHGVYVPPLSPTPQAHLNASEALRLLRPVLEDPTIPKCGHNVKSEALALR